MTGALVIATSTHTHLSGAPDGQHRHPAGGTLSVTHAVHGDAQHPGHSPVVLLPARILRRSRRGAAASRRVLHSRARAAVRSGRLPPTTVLLLPLLLGALLLAREKTPLLAFPLEVLPSWLTVPVVQSGPLAATNNSNAKPLKGELEMNTFIKRARAIAVGASLLGLAGAGMTMVSSTSPAFAGAVSEHRICVAGARGSDRCTQGQLGIGAPWPTNPAPTGTESGTPTGNADGTGTTGTTRHRSDSSGSPLVNTNAPVTPPVTEAVREGRAARARWSTPTPRCRHKAPRPARTVVGSPLVNTNAPVTPPVTEAVREGRAARAGWSTPTRPVRAQSPTAGTRIVGVTVGQHQRPRRRGAASAVIHGCRHPAMHTGCAHPASGAGGRV